MLGLYLAVQLLAATSSSDVRPVSEVWPYEAKRLPDGKVQLSYDLTGLKAGILDTEAATELDEPSLKALAERLPKEAKVTVEFANVPLSMDVPMAREKAPPFSSFGAVTSDALAHTPLDRRPGARLLPALHPDMPKLWLSLDGALWKARQANESILAGIELAADDGSLGLPMGGKAFWLGMLKATLERASQREGDAKEGALLLATHLAAALKRQGVATPNLPRSEQFSSGLEAVIDADDADKFAKATSLRSSFSGELRKLELRQRSLARALPDSRSGKAAALTFLLLLEKDAKLKAGYEALLKLRDTFVGKPANDELARWQKAVEEQGGASNAMDDFAEFVSRAQKANLKMPPLFAAASSPIDAYVDELGGPGQENARDEVVIALQDRRLQPDASDGAPWLSNVDAAFAGAVVPADKLDRPVVTRSRVYRDRVTAAFTATLPAPANDVDDDGDDNGNSDDARPYGLKVALKVPPTYGAEPSPQLFAKLAIAYERLEKLLAATGKAGAVSGVLPSGSKRTANNKTEVQKLKRLFRGLELHVAGTSPASPEDKEAVKVADQFIANWKSDPDLSSDIRFASELRGGGQLILYGIGREEVRVAWDGKPRATLTSKEGAEFLVLDVNASQRYLTPVIVTGAPQYPGTLPDRAAFRAISDRVHRDPAAVDASLSPGP